MSVRPLLLIAGLAISAPAFAQITVTSKAEGDHHALVADTPLMHVTVVPEWGGRIVSLVDKQIDRELVYFRDGQGGLLDERDEFTGTPFTFDIAADGGAVRDHAEAKSHVLMVLEGTAHGGFTVRKLLRFYPDKPFVQVQYQLSNRSQRDRVFWVRNFLRPAGEDLSEAVRWILPTPDGAKTLEARQADGYQQTRQAWAALVHPGRRSGVLTTCELGLFDKFYFWLSSKEFPTFEWVFQTIPAGKSVELWCYFFLLHDVETVDEDTVGRLAHYGNGLVRNEVRFTDLPGWRDLRPTFTPSEADRQRGFALYVVQEGKGAGLARQLSFDAPPSGSDSQWLTLTALRDVTADLSVQGALSERVTIWREHGEQRRLRRVQRLELKQGDIVLLLLTLEAGGWKTGERRGQLRAASPQGEQSVALTATVWNLAIPDRPLLYWHGYSASSYLHTRGYKLSEPDALERLRKFCADGSAIGHTVHHWDFLASLLLPHVRLRETGEAVAEADKKRPLLVEGHAPALDFSFLDPVAEIAFRFGLRYTNMVAPDPAFSATGAIYDLGWGRKVLPESEEGQKVYRWFVGEFVRYIRERGYPWVFGSVRDEISPEHLADYLAYARQAKSAGLRVFTTITGTPQQVETLLREMAQVNEGWQVQLCSTRAVEQLRRYVKPTDLLTFYGGSSKPYRLDYGYGRRYGWFAAAHGYPGYAWWAYVHWQPTENIVFEEDDGTLTRTPIWYGLRDGNLDGTLLRLLQAWTKRAENAARSPRQKQAVARAQSVLQRICSPDPNALLPLVERSYSGERYLWFPDELPDERLSQARGEVLKSLAQLQQAFPPPTFAPDLWWGDVKVAAGGKGDLRVVTRDKTMAQQLALRWREGVRRAMGLAGDGRSEEPSTQVVVFPHRPGDKELAPFGLSRAGLGVTDRYPPDGSYLMGTQQSGGRTLLALIGADEEGAGKGLRALLATLEPRW